MRLKPRLTQPLTTLLGQQSRIAEEKKEEHCQDVSELRTSQKKKEYDFIQNQSFEIKSIKVNV